MSRCRAQFGISRLEEELTNFVEERTTESFLLISAHLLTISGGLVPHVIGLGQGRLLLLMMTIVAVLRVLMRDHGKSRVRSKHWLVVQTIWMLLLLWVRMVAQVIVIAVVSRVAAIAGVVDVITITTTGTVVVVVLMGSEMDRGRDMVLMGMRMVDLLLLIMMRWELLLLLLQLMVVVAVIVMMLGLGLKMHLMIHATTVNRARNWGHVLLRLDFQWTQQR